MVPSCAIMGDMICQRCGLKELTGKQERFCSKHCSVLAAKARYRKAHPDRIREWKKKYYGGKPKITKDETDVVLKRYEYKCVRCSSKERLEVHHFFPVRCGGDHRLGNLIVFCKDCHALWHLSVGDFWNQ